MYTRTPEIKINKFKLVDIPKNRDYMARFGAVQTAPGMYGGEQEIPKEGRVTDDMETYRRYAQEMENHG